MDLPIVARLQTSANIWRFALHREIAQMCRATLNVAG
jgi:hypothetical protein